jgi:predicted signal transduction protein with EAL and GGDEF domain
MYVTFNIAPRHFTDSVVLNDVGSIFEGSPVSLSQIVLEITERFQIENLTATRRVIAALQGLGCRVALDDVGTGHNGLSYILKLGVDIIKIDRLFVEAIKTERHAQAIVETLVNLARNLRMQIVAEGVERIDQVEYLREHGISAAQGYLFAPPLPGPAFIKLVEAMDPLAGTTGQNEVAQAPKKNRRGGRPARRSVARWRLIAPRRGVNDKSRVRVAPFQTAAVQSWPSPVRGSALASRRGRLP